MDSEVKEQFFIGFLASAMAGAILWWVASRLESGTYPLTEFINPEYTSDIAAALPEDEDEFILASWKLVGSQVKYKPFGSIVEFQDSKVYCQNCLLPYEMLRMKQPQSNCVGKSAFLVSLLRNRLPPERVYMAVGKANVRGRAEGHAWVNVKRRDNNWYILESTVPPSPESPWYTADELRDLYLAEAFVNDYGLIRPVTTSHIAGIERLTVQGTCPCIC